MAAIPITIQVFKGGQVIRTEKLNQETIKIGKISSAHLQLEDESVSRLHANIEVTAKGEVTIVDLQSSKGTFVNGSKLAPSKPQTLKAGDEVKVGDVRDYTNFMGAVIDERAYLRITGYVERAQSSPVCTVLRAGASREKGWFIQPTLVEVSDPSYELLRDELFGPVMSVFVYPDNEVERALALCDLGSPYALTGAVFAQDRAFIERASRALRNTAGNFYINDKPTGAVVGQQPFGGARASGTNDKAGSALNLLRWVSPRTIKETFAPPTTWRYPFMAE